MKSLCVSILKTSQPAAPLFLLRKGKDVVINKSIVLEAFTDSKHVIKSLVPSTSTSLVLSPSPASKPATVTIMEWSPFLRQVVKAQNPLNGELSHGVITQAVHEGV